jgi:hypothetical protein
MLGSAEKKRSGISGEEMEDVRLKERCVLTSGMRRRRGAVISFRSSEESPVTAVAHLHLGVHLSGEHGERTGGPTTDQGAASAGWSSGERDTGTDPATSGDMR